MAEVVCVTSEWEELQATYQRLLKTINALNHTLECFQQRDFKSYLLSILVHLQQEIALLESKQNSLRDQKQALKEEVSELSQLLYNMQQTSGNEEEEAKLLSANCAIIESKDIELIPDWDYNALPLGDDQWSQKIFRLLSVHKIRFQLIKHEAVYTCEEASKFDHFLHGASCKNLFLTDKKRKHYFVFSALETTAFRINDLKKKIKAQHPEIQCGNLQFGKESELNSRLKLIKGSVTPFGILNDEKQETVLLIDQNLMQQECAKFHPLVNTMTISIKMTDFVALVDRLNYKYYVVKVD